MTAGTPITDPDLLGTDWMRISRAVAIELGAPALTLAGLYEMAGSKQGYKTFASMASIADRSCLGVRTCIRHIEQLIGAGYVTPLGRERQNTGKGKPRRTVTYKLTAKAIEARQPYLQLPRWAARQLDGYGVKFVLGFLVSRQLMAARVEDNEEFGCFEDITVVSTTEVIRNTGLNPQAVRHAKQLLTHAKWIVCWDGWREDGGEAAQQMQLNPDCIIPAPHKPPGECGRVVSPSKAPSKGTSAGESDRHPRVIVAETLGESDRHPRVIVADDPQVKVADAINLITLTTCSNQQLLSTHGPNQQPRASSRSMDLLHFEVEHIQDTCWYLYAKLAAPSGDCANLWKITALLKAGKLTEAQVVSAIEGVRMCHPGNRLAYFYTTLSNALASEGRDLKAEAAKVSLSPKIPKAPPKPHVPCKASESVCAALKLPPAPKEARDEDHARREALAFLDAQMRKDSA